MARILVLYYSSYGHIAKMADAVAEGVRQAGHECDIRRVPETAPPEVAQAAGFVADHSHELVSGIAALPEYDGLVIGAPTRFGRMPSQMAAFLDQAGGLWYTDALVGKAAAAFIAKALVRSPTMLWVCLGGAAQLIVVSAIWSWLPSFLNRYHGIAPDQAGVKAALWGRGRAPGLYSMADVLGLDTL